MKYLLGALCAFGFALTQAVGFDGDTLVTMASGRLKPIKEISIGDSVVCYNKNLEQVHSTIKGICVFKVETTVHIITQDNIEMVVSGLERFFLPKEGAWVCAQNLKAGDCLLNDDLECVAITSVQQSSEPQEMYAITVDKLHNFLASHGRYLVHNGPLAAWQAYWATKIALYGAIGVTITGTTVVAGGAIAAAGAATATTGTVATGLAAGLAEATVVGVTSAGVGVTGTIVGTAVTTTAGILGGAEAAIATGAMVTSANAMVTLSGATAGATGVAGVYASTVMAIEAAAAAAAAAAMTCPFTPW